MNLLHPGDAFPSLTVARPGGDTLELPQAVAGDYAVVLLFRGSWCPFCNAQLRAFERSCDRLAELGVRVVALSADDEASTRALVDKHGLTFPVGHGADPTALHDALGAFVSGEPPYVESTGFVLDPDGRIVVSVYSSGAIGRLMPDDVMGFVRYLRDKAPAEAA
jgi:peroxiredoxin